MERREGPFLSCMGGSTRYMPAAGESQWREKREREGGETHRQVMVVDLDAPAFFSRRVGSDGVVWVGFSGLCITPSSIHQYSGHKTGGER